MSFAVLLRNCEPGSKDYPDGLVMNHLAQLDVDSFKDEGFVENGKGEGFAENISKHFDLEFAVYGIEKEGVITKDNFISDFVPGFVIEPRRKNIDALREGLTLDGT